MFLGEKNYASELESKREGNEIVTEAQKSVPSEQNRSKKNPEILLDGTSIPYQYVDSIYPLSKTFGINVTQEKSRQLKVNHATYLTNSDENGWKIKGQFWKEKNTQKFEIKYANTTGFSMNLPNRDYKVTVQFSNNEKKKYKIISWDERGMQTNSETVPAGGSLKQEFEVSVINGNLKLFFTPETNAFLSDQGWREISIKSLTLETMPKRQKGSVPTLYITGDSTAHSRSEKVYPREGWGQELYRCFGNGRLQYKKKMMTGNKMASYTEYKMSSLIIQNWAYSGESTQSFWRKGRFDNLLNNVKPGDYVMIQFGHNDASKKKLGYYVTPSAYRKNLITFAKACQERGAICIFLSPTPRCIFEHGKIKSAVPEYKSAMKNAAHQSNAVFIDAGKAVENYMNTVGKKKALSYYMVLKRGQYANYHGGYHDNSHYNYTGAKKASHIIAVTLKENQSVPASLRKQITISNDYYQGVIVDIDKVHIKKITENKKKASEKTKKIQYKLSWSKQKNAKYYVIYQYIPSNKSYKKIAMTKKTTYVLLKKWTKKQLLHKIKVKAVLARY